MNNRFNLEEQIVHEKVNGTIERGYGDRREIIHLERLFQDRVNGAVGLKIRSIEVAGDSFILLCSDGKKKSLKHLNEQKREIEKVIEEAKANGDEKEVKRMEEYKQNLYQKLKQNLEQKEGKKKAKEKHLETAMFTLVNDMYSLRRQTPEDVKDKVDKIRKKFVAKAQAEAQ